MIIDKELLLRVGETKDQYLLRVGSSREKFDLSWQDATDILNDQLKLNHTESAYRKTFKSFERLLHASGGGNDNATLADLRREREELFKERVRLRDEQNEKKRLLRSEARVENVYDTIRSTIKEYRPLRYDALPTPTANKAGASGTMVIMLSDMHGGIDTENAVSDYSPALMRERLGDYKHQIENLQKQNHTSECLLLLGGDMVSGVIHGSLRHEATQNVIEQVMDVSDAVIQFTRSLASIFNTVHVRSVEGNHGRVTAKKDDRLRGENFDNLIPFNMQLALREQSNVIIHDPVDPTLDVFVVQGKKCALVHGDRDQITTVVQRLVPVAGQVDYVFMSHLHTTGMHPSLGMSKVIVNGSLGGSDVYAFENRYFSTPEQIVFVISPNGPDALFRCNLKGGDSA